MKTFDYIVKDELGLHARPAGLLVKQAAKFSCNVRLAAPAKTVDAKRIMAVMGACVKQGDAVTVECEGPDEAQAAQTLQAFFEQNL